MPKLTIFCDIAAREHPESTPDLIYAQSPLSCLSLAEIHAPDFIIIRSEVGSIEKNAKLVELCACLKRDDRTSGIPLIVLLQYPQRALASELRQYDVDYVQFIDGTPVTPDLISGLVSSRDTLLSPAAFEESVCPYINYELFNEEDEIALCRADLNRLVINGRRLRRYCGGGNHRTCPYFQNPRLQTSYQ